MKRITRYIALAVTIAVLVAMLMFALAGCRQASRVSYNVSKSADNFNVTRRLTVLNTRSDKPMFELIAAFSINVDEADNQLEIVCEVGDGIYKKHFIGLNEWTTYVIEDVGGVNVNKYRYEVNFLPEMIVPLSITSED